MIEQWLNLCQDPKFSDNFLEAGETLIRLKFASQFKVSKTAPQNAFKPRKRNRLKKKRYRLKEKILKPNASVAEKISNTKACFQKMNKEMDIKSLRSQWKGWQKKEHHSKNLEILHRKKKEKESESQSSRISHYR